MTRIATVRTELELRLVVPGGPSLPVLADLRYSADDPWAVRVAFQTGGEGDGIVEWMFARQLLTDGVSGTVGEGDVRVWPSKLGREHFVGSHRAVCEAVANGWAAAGATYAILDDNGGLETSGWHERLGPRASDITVGMHS